MEATNNSASASASASASRAAVYDQYPPLELVNRPTVPTCQAAFYLNRAQQTLRIWACREDGPIRPIRVNGRLAWNVAEIKRVLGVQ